MQNLYRFKEVILHICIYCSACNLFKNLLFFLVFHEQLPIFPFTSLCEILFLRGAEAVDGGWQVARWPRLTSLAKAKLMFNY